jgi:hypothetical protein
MKNFCANNNEKKGLQFKFLKINYYLIYIVRVIATIVVVNIYFNINNKYLNIVCDLLFLNISIKTSL